MNIAFVSWYNCTRCMKEARMLAKAGHKIWLFGFQSPTIPEKIPLESVFFQICRYTNPDQLRNFLTGLDFIDIVHVHNEPSWMVNVAKEAGCQKVILDAHDLGVVRNGWDNLDENGRQDLQALSVADGLIVPCDKYIDILEEHGKLTIPWLTIYSYVNEDDMIDQTGDLGGIVYEGSIYAPAPNHPFPYRIYTPVAQEIVKMNIPFYIYPSTAYQQYMPYYQSIGCRTMSTTDPGTMVKNLSRHGWGFCGSPVRHRQWDNTLSNKFYEYMAAGIPSFIYQAKATEEKYGSSGLGIVINDLEQVKEFYFDTKIRNELVESIKENRSRFTMESQTSIINDFYQTVLNR